MKDMHNHILFSIDDGSKDIETSIAMLKNAQESGMDEMILRENSSNVPESYHDNVSNYAHEIRNSAEILLGQIKINVTTLRM